MLTGSPRAAVSNKGGLGKQAIFVVSTLSLGGCTTVRPSIAAAVSNFKLSRQVAALLRAKRGVSWAFLLHVER